MVKSGMVAAGYKSLNIDDCWPMKARDNKTGEIVPDPTKFPEGMAAFSKALARKGVALGIYTAHGPKTCQGFPGSLGYETIDAQTYASWNVVYVKNDYCWHHEPSQAKHLNAFNAMRDALNQRAKGWSILSIGIMATRLALRATGALIAHFRRPPTSGVSAATSGRSGTVY